MTIQDLAAREDELIARVYATNGSMDEKTQQLKDDGVYESYREIHKDYASLATAGDIESLKRALFIQWYSVSEPSCFTGIQGVDKDVEKTILFTVEQLILTGHADEELNFMLAWYYQISDYYFDSFGANSFLSKILRQYIQNFSNLFDRLQFIEQIEGRGQLGKYWASIIRT